MSAPPAARFWSQLWALEVFLLVRFARGRLVHVFVDVEASDPSALDAALRPLPASQTHRKRLERLVAKATKVRASRVHLHSKRRAADGALDFTIYAQDYPSVSLMLRGEEVHGLSKGRWRQWRKEEAEELERNLEASRLFATGEVLCDDGSGKVTAVSADCVPDDEEANFQEEKDRIFQSWFVVNYLACQWTFLLLVGYGIYLYDPSDVAAWEWESFDCEGVGWGTFHW